LGNSVQLALDPRIRRDVTWECVATGCVFRDVMWAVGGRPVGTADFGAAAGWGPALAWVLIAGRPGCRTLEGGTAAKGLASALGAAAA
jgi:hypothetical protein